VPAHLCAAAIQSRIAPGGRCCLAAGEGGRGRGDNSGGKSRDTGAAGHGDDADEGQHQWCGDRRDVLVEAGAVLLSLGEPAAAGPGDDLRRGLGHGWWDVGVPGVEGGQQRPPELFVAESASGRGYGFVGGHVGGRRLSPGPGGDRPSPVAQIADGVGTAA
jgi:hypothetical protein